jgi:hypothetical protein
MAKVDYNLEAIKKTVLEKYPEEPGNLTIALNAGTSSIFAFALFTQGKEGSEVRLEDIDTISHYGLPIKVQRAKPLTRR